MCVCVCVYVCCYSQRDCFVLSQLISEAKHVSRFRL